MKYWTFLIFFLQSTMAMASDLSERLSGFSTIEASSGNFVETWRADYLDEPLISKGELRYKRPGQLRKLITEPTRIEQHIEDGQLSVIHNGKTNSIPLSEQPELAAGIYALQAVLDGDEEKLQKLFVLKYSDSNDNWNLTLTPKDKQVADSIESIIMQGNGNRIQRVAIRFYNGDNLLTEITHGD
ncbi:MAG: hypothetical protein COA54_14360 [Thiotrichaceae bacterium]|nr:MAG: hypothetical protein COA54_14360 [Thiotrichaceae bacterium]